MDLNNYTISMNPRADDASREQLAHWLKLMCEACVYDNGVREHVPDAFWWYDLVMKEEHEKKEKERQLAIRTERAEIEKYRREQEGLNRRLDKLVELIRQSENHLATLELPF